MTTYTFTPIDDPSGANGTFAGGINDAGQVVGSYYDSSSAAHGFLYSGGTYITLNDPSGINTKLYGINDADYVVGTFQSGGAQGFVHSAATYSTIDDPLGANGTELTGINNSGLTVGSYSDISGVLHGFIFNLAFATLNGPSGTKGTTALGVNDAGQIVGDYFDGNGAEHSYLYSGGNFTTLNDPSAATNETFAIGINDLGQIVGFYIDGSGTQHGFVYSGGAYSTIDDALGTNTVVTGINNAGEITGYYTSSSGTTQAFLATPPPTTSYTFNTVNEPSGAGGTQARGINDAGEMVGIYVDSSGASHGFLFYSNVLIFPYSTLNDPLASGSNGTQAWGINNAGQIVGSYEDSSNGEHGFFYSGGTYTPLNDPLAIGGTQAFGINNLGQIVGSYTDGIGTHGFLLSGGAYSTFNDPLGVKGTQALGINDAGQIAGIYTDSSGAVHGFLYSGGTYITLNDPLGTGLFTTVANGINDAGQIVGYYGDRSGVAHGFLYSDGTYTTINDPLGIITGPFGINDEGQITGAFDDNSGVSHGFLADPQPSTAPPPPTSVQLEILGLYAALYNRAADFPGYSYWVGIDGQQTDSGGVTVANAGTTAVTLNDAQVLGQAFVNTQSTFFNATYGSLTDMAFVKALYLNIGGNAGDMGGVNYWVGKLTLAEDSGASVQAARAGLVGQFVHDLIDFDLTPGAAALGLTAAQYQDAQTRQATIDDKIAVSLGYSNISQQPGGTFLDALSVGDAAYNAAVKVIQGVTSDPGTVTVAITGINNAVAHQDLTLI